MQIDNPSNTRPNDACKGGHSYSRPLKSNFQANLVKFENFDKLPQQKA